MRFIIIRGIPGSGKSTLARQLQAEIASSGLQCNWYEADQYFENSAGVYEFDRRRLFNAHKWCTAMTELSLQIGIHTIVSNTFTTIGELRPYFEMAQMNGVSPEVITATGEYGSVHNVPEETLAKMRTRFQHDISALTARFV